MNLVPTLIRYTANVAMFLGILVALLAGWDYLGGGPGAGQRGTLVGVAVGVLVFLCGAFVFRRMARDMETGESR